MTEQRTLIGRVNGIAGRQRVYRVWGGIEIDQIDQHEITRKRVFFDDVLAITHHKQIGWGWMVVASSPGILFSVIGGIMVFNSDRDVATGAWFIMAIAALMLIPAILRLIVKVDVITVYGRRTKGEMHFSYRKRRARELFAQLVSEVRRAHDRIAAQTPVTVKEEFPPIPDGLLPAQPPPDEPSA